jgi:hypothetical protein
MFKADVLHKPVQTIKVGTWTLLVVKYQKCSGSATVKKKNIKK